MFYLNGQPLDITRFPDGTSQVWKLPESVFQSDKVDLYWDFSTEADIMHLAQLEHLLTTKNRNISITLTIKYLPYARQDKVVSNEATFALQTFLKILRTMQFKKIVVMDPHNFDACRFGCQFEAVYPTKEVARAMEVTESTLVCYPDKGALNKYTKIYDYPYIYGEKVREQSTGHITSYKVIGDPKDKNVLIVDDICDGGMTFKLLAENLLAAGAKEVNLFVTHGIFSKGLKTLRESGIKRIFTQDGEAFQYRDNGVFYKEVQ